MDPRPLPTRSSLRKGLLACALATLPAACDVPRVVGVYDDGSRVVPISLAQTADVDVLFVVDTSPSMGPKQARVRAAAAALATLAGRGKLRIAAISADLGAGNAASAPGCRRGGDGALLRPVGAAADPACAPPRDGRRFLELDAATGTTNLPDGRTLNQSLDCMLAAGTDGCMIQQPLAAARAALLAARDRELSRPEDRFLRDDAQLLVIFVTDGDDCSLPPGGDLFDPGREPAYGPLAPFRCARFGVAWGYPPRLLGDEPSHGPLAAPQPAPLGIGRLADAREFRDFFTRTAAQGGLKADPNRVVVTTVSGTPGPFAVDLVQAGTDRTAAPVACTGGPDCRLAVRPTCVEPDTGLFGDPAVRLSWVASAVRNNYPASICAADQSTNFAQAASLVERQQHSPGCLPGLLPDPAAPACAAWDVIPLGGGQLDRRSIPACATAGETRPCWRVQSDESCAWITDPDDGPPQHYRVVIDRGNTPIPPGSTPEARCALHGAGPG